VEETVADIFINKSIDEWRRLEAVVKTMEDILNIFSNNLNNFTVHKFTIRPSAV